MRNSRAHGRQPRASTQMRLEQFTMRTIAESINHFNIANAHWLIDLDDSEENFLFRWSSATKSNQTFVRLKVKQFRMYMQM